MSNWVNEESFLCYEDLTDDEGDTCGREATECVEDKPVSICNTSSSSQCVNCFMLFRRRVSKQCF